MTLYIYILYITYLFYLKKYGIMHCKKQMHLLQHIAKRSSNQYLGKRNDYFHSLKMNSVKT